MYYFVYHYKHNSPFLTRKVDFVNGIDNLRIKIVKCISALKMKICVDSLQKQTIGLIFNIQNSQSLNWPLPKEEIFQVHGQNRPVISLPVVDFRSQPREMPLTKPLST